MRSLCAYASLFLRSLAIAALLLVAAPARADDAAPAAAPQTKSHWYGPRILLTDGIAAAVIVAGSATGAGPVAVLGIAGWLGASPIVHASHAGPVRAVESLALRLALPTAAFLLARQATDGCWRETGASDTCDIGAEAVAIVVGIAAAETIDVAWLAHDEHPVEPPPMSGQHASAQFVVAPRTGGALMAVMGRF